MNTYAGLVRTAARRKIREDTNNEERFRTPALVFTMFVDLIEKFAIKGVIYVMELANSRARLCTVA
jgi:hypothetical protein